MFKDSHVWLQITLRNQIPKEFGFPFKPPSVGMWILFKIGEYSDSQT